MRLIPSRAAIWAALAALVTAALAWLRHDARRDVTETLEREDLKHADAISDRVADSRADPDRVQRFDDAGYRD